MVQSIRMKRGYLILPIIALICLLSVFLTQTQGAIAAGPGQSFGVPLKDYYKEITSPSGPSLRVCTVTNAEGETLAYRFVAYRNSDNRIYLHTTSQNLTTKVIVYQNSIALNASTDNTPAITCTKSDQSGNIDVLFSWHAADGTNSIYVARLFIVYGGSTCVSIVPLICLDLVDKQKLNITSPNAPILGSTSTDAYLTWRGGNNLLYMMRNPHNDNWNNWGDKISFNQQIANAPTLDVFTNQGREDLFVSWLSLESRPRVHIGTYNTQTKTLQQHLSSTATTSTRASIATRYPTSANGGPSASVIWKGFDNNNIYMDQWNQSTLNWAGNRVLATDTAGNLLQSSSPVVADVLESYNDIVYFAYTEAQTNRVVFRCVAETEEQCLFIHSVPAPPEPTPTPDPEETPIP